MSFGVIWLGGGTCENGVLWEDLLQMSVLSSDLMLEACSLQISEKISAVAAIMLVYL